MSEKQEHRKRYNRRLQYIASFDKWAKEEPPLPRWPWIFKLLPGALVWRRWYDKKPVWREDTP